MPPYVYPHSNHYASAGEASQYHETPFGSKPHYLFVTRQLLHYIVPHLYAEHDDSRVHQNNVYRERYRLPAILSHPHWDTGYQWTSTAHKTLPKMKSIFNFFFFFFQIAWSGPGLRQLFHSCSLPYGVFWPFPLNDISIKCYMNPVHCFPLRSLKLSPKSAASDAHPGKAVTESQHCDDFGGAFSVNACLNLNTNSSSFQRSEVQNHKPFFLPRLSWICCSFMC